MSEQRLPTKRNILVAVGIGVGCLAVVALAFTAGSASSDEVAHFNSAGDSLDAACEQAFAEEWTARIWIPADPPELRCEGPDGQVGYMDIPAEFMDGIPIQTPGDQSE